LRFEFARNTFYLCKNKGLKVLLIDNYDSFTFNIVEMLRQLNVTDLSIVKNNEITAEQASHFDKIIISPGPATPQESGNIVEIIVQLSPTKSILGICLGHQAIAEAFGGTLQNLARPYHGFRAQLKIKEAGYLFKNLPTEFQIGLYHSWIVEKETLPNCLEVTALSSENIIMSIKHKTFDVQGIQFHPESFMTEYGKEMIRNWLAC
jgi:anthranilate synthase component 2